VKKLSIEKGTPDTLTSNKYQNGTAQSVNLSIINPTFIAGSVPSPSITISTSTLNSS